MRVCPLLCMVDQSSIWRSLRRNSSPPSVSNTVLTAGQTDQPEAGQDTRTEKERQDRRIDRETELTEREKDIQKESQTDRMINRQVDKEKDRQGRRIERWTERQNTQK